MSRKNAAQWALLLGFLALAVIANARLEAPVGEPVSGRARAVDGDSLELAGHRIRLIGIDAPELDQVCAKAGGELPCGQRAHAELRFMVSEKNVECETFGKDRYDRTLARCRAGTVDLGSAMVGAGWAISDGRYQRQEEEARRDRRGIWAGDFELPADWRAGRRSAPAEPFWRRFF